MKKVLNINNCNQFNPSEFVRSFLDDVKYAEERDRPMDMDNFDFSRMFPKIGMCLPCLGGIRRMRWDSDINNEELSQRIMNCEFLGDSIRCGDSNGINYHLTKIYPNYKKIPSLPYLKAIRGIIEVHDFEIVRDRINIYADLIQNTGQ